MKQEGRGCSFAILFGKSAPALLPCSVMEGANSLLRGKGSQTVLLCTLTTAAQEHPLFVTLDLSFILTIYHNMVMWLYKTYPRVPQGNANDKLTLFYSFGRFHQMKQLDVLVNL